jgi:hypothetical protein
MSPQNQFWHLPTPHRHGTKLKAEPPVFMYSTMAYITLFAKGVEQKTLTILLYVDFLF